MSTYFDATTLVPPSEFQFAYGGFQCILTGLGTFDLNLKMTRKIRVPHTLILLFGMMAAALVLTWLLPSGQFETEKTATGRTVVVPGTYRQLADPPVLPPWSLLTVIPRAMADAQAVIFFLLLIGGVLGVVRSTGAIDAFIGRILEHFRQHLSWLVLVSMVAFGIFSAMLGMSAEYIAFVGILIALFAALHLDSVAAIGIIVVGYGIGYGVALLNPFTVLIAQEIAELPPGSGIGFRAVVLALAFLVGFHHVWAYAKRVLKNPDRSLVADIQPLRPPVRESYPQLTGRRIAVLLACLATLGILVLGVIRFGWYLTELSALFLGLCIAAAILARLPLNQMGETFIDGAAQLTGTALLVGFARSIALLLEDGLVLHTIVHGLATPLSHVPAELSAVGMLLIQSVLNLFIPSGSGQAFATMPIMAPIGDLVGVSRQISVLAYQFGDGFTNMVVPTNPVLMGVLGMAGIPFDRWLKFIFPLILKLLVFSSVVLIIAVRVGYS